jgi:hypothetical protein
LICATEDAEGADDTVRRRATAHGRAQHITTIDGGPNLSSLSDTVRFFREALALARDSTAPPFVLFILDVFRECFSGDENSSEVVSAAMSVTRVAAKMFGVTILIAHHAGRADAERARGSIAFDGALDFIAVLSAPAPGTIALKVTKNRAGMKGDTHLWHFDADGVLQPGPGKQQETPESTEGDAALLSQLIYEIASVAMPATRQQIAAALGEANPARLGAGAKRTTAQSRIDRTIVMAVDRQWVSRAPGRGAERFVPGPEAAAGVIVPIEAALEGAQ